MRTPLSPISAAARFLGGAVAGLALAATFAACTRAHADPLPSTRSPITNLQQQVMVLTAVDITENAQCGARMHPRTFARLAKAGMTVDDVSAVSGRYYQDFFITMEAISQIYLLDPKGFCARAAAHAAASNRAGE